MARIRTVKPEFFTHEDLFNAEVEEKLPLRVAFSGLWTVCDREGRFKWRPNTIKLAVLPFDEVDFSRVLDALASRGFIVKYVVEGENFGYVPSWEKHQVINNRESESTLPPPIDGEICKSLPNGYENTGDGFLSKKTGFIYIAYAKKSNAFKIGFAEQDPERRVADLSCGSPEPLCFLEAINGEKQTETIIHRALKDHKIHGEWFHVTSESIQLVGAWFTRAPRVLDAEKAEGKGREEEEEGKRKGKGKEGTVADAPKKNAKTMLSELGVEDQTAKDWLEIRKAKRAPLTQTALDDLVREAGKAGITVNEAVTICARRSWQGFNASWDWQGKGVRAGEQDKDQAREGARARLFGEKNAAE